MEMERDHCRSASEKNEEGEDPSWFGLGSVSMSVLDEGWRWRRVEEDDGSAAILSEGEGEGKER